MGARQSKPRCFLDAVRLLFSRQVAGRNNSRKTFLDELIGLGSPRMRLFANRCPRSIESGEDTGGIDGS